jgi:hypothetical protein
MRHVTELFRIDNLHARPVTDEGRCCRDPARPVAHGRRGRGARHHGPQRLGQEHPGQHAAGPPPSTRSPTAASASRATTSPTGPPTCAPRPACSWRSSTRRRSPASRSSSSCARPCRPARASTSVVLELRLATMDWMKRLGMDSGVRRPLPQRGLQRRREEAQRDPADGHPRARARDPRRDRLRPRHRRAAHRGQGDSRGPPTAPRWASC